MAIDLGTVDNIFAAMPVPDVRDHMQGADHSKKAYIFDPQIVGLAVSVGGWAEDAAYFNIIILFIIICPNNIKDFAYTPTGG